MTYRVKGQTPTIIVLHGGPGAIGSASGLADLLDNVIELYNVGQSIDEQLDEIRAVVKAFSIKELTLIGHSFGAWLGFIYASKYKVSKLILVGCGAFEEQYLGKMNDKRFINLTDDEKLITEQYFKDLSKGREIEDLNSFACLMAKMDSYEIDSYSDKMMRFDFEGHQKLMAEIKSLRQSGDLLRLGLTISAEVVIVHGKDDPHPIDGITHPFDKINLEYRLFLIDQCGHTPWNEKYGRKTFMNIIKNETTYLFQSERLGFRRFQKTDAEFFYKMNSNQEVMRYFPSSLTQEESNQFLNRIIKSHHEQGFGLYALERLEDQIIIGFIGFSIPSFEAEFMPCVEIGWRLYNDFWKKGYATEGASRALDYGFNVLDFKEVVSFTAEINKPSVEVMKRIGLSYQKTFNHPKVPNSPLEKHVLYKRSQK